MNSLGPPRFSRFQKSGALALLFLALTQVPIDLLGYATALLVIVIFFWSSASTASTGPETKRLLRLIFSRKLQRIVLYALLFWLCRVLFSTVAFTNPFSRYGLATEQMLPLLPGLPDVPLASIPLLFPAAYLVAASLSLICHRILQDGRKCLEQLWTDISLGFFNIAHFVLIMAIGSGEAGDWFTNFFISVGRDANLHSIEQFMGNLLSLSGNAAGQGIIFEAFIKIAFTTVLYVVSSQPASRLAVTLVASIKRAIGRSPGELLETPGTALLPVLEAMKIKKTKMKLAETNAWFKHTSASFWWIITCYLTLFGVFGFMGGPLGDTICHWFDSAFASANFNGVHVQAVPALRWFCGAIVALYGTIPLAVTGAIFLPFLRRKEIILSEDGMFLPDGPRFSLYFRTFRTWDDFKSISLMPSQETEIKKRAIKLEFHSGGHLILKISQFSPSDLHDLLAGIDENAPRCRIAEDIIAVRDVLADEDRKTANAADLRNRSAENYMSTIFVPFSPGEIIKEKQVRIVRLLASKPLSAVYLARDSRGQFIIVKQFFLADETRETQAMKKVFSRECEILKKLNHPSIARVVDHFQDGNSSFLLLEQAQGTDLRSVVQEGGKKSEKSVFAFAEQIARIMAYLHEQDPPVVHRDLTPDNIIIDARGNLRLIDFGAAHQFLEGLTGTMIGKQCYTAPEQLRGNASPRSDVYSFGCTLYYLLTGEDPVALSQCSPADKVPVSPALDRLVRSCTEFEEKDRLQSFSQILSEIEHCRTNPFWQGDKTAQLELEYDVPHKTVATAPAGFESRLNDRNKKEATAESIKVDPLPQGLIPVGTDSIQSSGERLPLGSSVAERLPLPFATQAPEKAGVDARAFDREGLTLKEAEQQ